MLVALEFLLKCVRCIVCSEHLGGKTLHLSLEVLVEIVRLDLVKEVVVLCLTLLESKQVLADLRIKFNFVMVAH
jgi:hypothetical protein